MRLIENIKGFFKIIFYIVALSLSYVRYRIKKILDKF